MSPHRYVLLSLLVGCATDANLSATVSHVGSSPGGDDDGCPVWGCGGNSPAMDFAGFHELHERGIANDAGFRITRFQKYYAGAWRSYRADVVGGELVARSLADPTVIVHRRSGIAGSRFTIMNEITGKQFILEVSEVGKMITWTNPFAEGVSYLLRWQEITTTPSAAGRWYNVCSSPGGPNDDGSMDPYHALLFDDDRIDADSIQVWGETRDWFTIGCAGHALAKLHLTGNTKASSAAIGVTTTLEQRTAHLKMLAADYCGTGDPFTVPGIELHWRDRDGYFNTVGPSDPIEARWSENGAICVNTPRVEYSATGLSLDTFGPDIRAELDEFGCRLPPPCTGSNTEMFEALALSANY